ncbi:hypothetical protein D3C86_2118490 [compost metagenome]
MVQHFLYQCGFQSGQADLDALFYQYALILVELPGFAVWRVALDGSRNIVGCPGCCRHAVEWIRRLRCQPFGLQGGQ